MQLTQHFTLEEFTASDTAQRLRIDNSLPSELIAEAIKTAEMAERIRSLLCKLAGKEVPIQITSGYRCLALNRALDSSDTSDHRKMAALDFKAPKFGPPIMVCRAIKPVMRELGIGQLIYEFDSWVHVGRPEPAREINRVLTINAKGVRPGILES